VRREATASPAGTIDATTRTFGRLALVTVFAACFLIWASTGAAQAATSYISQGETGNGTLGNVPTDVAIDDTTGYVLVVDSSNDRVVVFESSQPGAAVVTTFGEGDLSSPYGIAIDQSNGDVYVSDAGNDRIVRYTSDGQPTPTYTLDATYTSPAKGTGAEEIGNFASTLAVDPANGDLLVADVGNLRVERFDSSGAFVESFDGSDSDAGAFTSLLDIATGPDSSIYVIANGIVEPELGNVQNSVVDKFAAVGTFVEALAPGELGNARALGYDADLDNVLVTNGGSFTEGRNIFLRAVHNGQLTGSYEIFTAEECSLAVGIAIPGDPDAALSILTARDVPIGCGVASLLSVKGVVVDVTLSAPTAVTASGAHLSGTVDPHGDSGTAHFEYRRPGAADWTPTEDQAVEGDGPQAVEEDLVGLLPNRPYEVRLVANIAGLTEVSPPQDFETEVVAPTVSTQGATEIPGNGATIYGRVNPNGTPTTFYFEYGLTEAYGTRIPLVPAPAGEDHTALLFSRALGGLTAGATYHYRIVAENSAGVVEGEDMSFVAESPAPEGRAYEQVTPVEKEGGLINAFEVRASADGSSVAYPVATGSGNANTVTFAPHFLSVRGASDWNPWINVDPPITITGQIPNFFTSAAVSDDGGHAFVISNRALAPGADPNPLSLNIYVANLRSGGYELVGTSDDPFAWSLFTAGGNQNEFMAGAPDFSWVVFFSDTPLLPDVTSAALYRWSRDDGLEVVSQPESTVDRGVPQEAAPHFASEDGSRVFFGLAEGGVYAWEDGQRRALSVSEVSGEVEPAVFDEATRDGRFVLLSSVERLTEDAPEASPFEEQGLYRVNVETGDVVYVGMAFWGASVFTRGSILGISDDGSIVYYSGLESGELKPLRVWEDGETDVVDSTPPGVRVQSTVSTTGRYLVYYNKGDIYLYDHESDQRSCASCRAGEPTREASFPGTDAAFGRRFARTLTEDGDVYFTSSAGLVPKDTNGLEDVYVYRRGRQSLISPGDAGHAARLGDISADGRDVFFITTQGLVAQDTDGQIDLYDARVGGGFASQNQNKPTPCVAEGCQPPAASPPSSPSIGSEGDGTSKSRVHGRKHKRCAKTNSKAKAKKRCKHHGKKHKRKTGETGRQGR
jgi:DNA-binding beta-propeller fold protein YncE